jgi:hypothetical protein
MKSISRVLIFTAAIFVTLLVTGCVQNSPSAAGNGAGIHVSPSLTAPTGPYQGPPDAGIAPVGSQRQYQGQGQRPLSNATVLAGAAEKLGVPESQLESALASPSGGRVNFTSAAQQLGVTPQQLAEALGIPAGSQGPRNGTSSRDIPP